MPLIQNEQILASAGSGKTFQLTNRYIGLMGLQLRAGREVTPESIIAVTFTRKAAGEFFDSILEKLAKAATDPDAIANMSGGDDALSQSLADLSHSQYTELLRIFISRMPRLFLGTLDSFYSNILRSFPSEFGLAGDFEILDQHLEGLARRNVYRSVFQRRFARGDDGDPAQREFLEAFRQATFGKESARVRKELDRFISDLHGLYLEAPAGRRWGNPNVIWPNGCDFLGKKADWEKDFTELFTLFRAADDPEGGKEAPTRVQWGYWEEFRAEAPLHKPGGKMTNRIGYILKAFLPQWEGLKSGNVTITLNKKAHIFGPGECAILRRILGHLVGAEISTKLARTNGIWQLLDRYETTYSDRIRRQGKLTFHDLALLLAGRIDGGESDAPILTQMPDEDDRLQIDYRLDARYDHWLLDEFQDTSFLQWKVISNLVDEAVQDTSGERSLFQVGDVKQSIYGWRGGDPTLFGDIHQLYNQHGTEQLVRRGLDVSFRSGHDVIDTVNKVFGVPAVFEELGLPSDTIARWEWTDHEVSSQKGKLKGFTALINPLVPDGEKPEEEDRFAVALAILKEMQPVERGIECAILVQSNKVGHRIVDYIRANSDISVMNEADVSIATDNALNRAALSYVQLAAHPSDTFAWEHLKLTPFSQVITRDELTPAKLSGQVRDQIFEKGFEKAVRGFTKALTEVPGVELDGFSLRRGEDLALAARLFDEDGARDIDEFLDYARNHSVREPDAKSAVQVMTIHKSKGLTFDAVILPDLEGNALTTARNDIGAKKNHRREIEWVLDLPKKEIYENDEVLSEYHAEREAGVAYENLCKLYVAMTRARCANYLITQKRGKTSKSENMVKLLETALVSTDAEQSAIGELEVNFLFESDLPTTSPTWYEDRKVPEPPEPKNFPDIAVDPTLARVRVSRRTPSGAEKAVITAAQIFSSEGRAARNFGTLVHAMFEEIEWFDDDTLSKLESFWSERVEANEAFAHVRRALESQEFREALNRPSADAEVWRERNFEILLEGQWLSGTFDRVVVEPDRAMIIDFKTDRVGTAEVGTSDDIAKAVEKYRPQLDAYAEVLERMTGLTRDKIEMKLLFSTPRRVVTL